MGSQGNGKYYRISFSGLIAAEIKKLIKEAKAAGIGPAFVKALQQAMFRMEHDPWEFGEQIGRLHHGKAVIHVAMIKPLLIEFVIQEERPIVFIRRVQLLF